MEWDDRKFEEVTQAVGLMPTDNDPLKAPRISNVETMS